MSCFATRVSTPLLGSCRSPSLKNCGDIDSSAEMMHSGSPVLRSSPLNNAGSPSLNLSFTNVNHQHHHSPSKNASSPSLNLSFTNLNHQLHHSPSKNAGSPSLNLSFTNLNHQHHHSPSKNAGSPNLNLSFGNVNHQHHHSPSKSSMNASRLRPIIHDQNQPPPLQVDHTHNMSVLGQSLKVSLRGSRQRIPTKAKEYAELGVLTEINTELENDFGSLNVLSSPPLKRKRPPKLDIPKSPRELKSIDLNDQAAKEESVSFEGGYYGFYCKKGKKKFMEDTHKVTTNINGDDQQAFFGVYDGHGGRKAAEFVAEKLGQNIEDLMVKSVDLEKAIKAGYLATDKQFLEQGVSSGACCVTASIKDGCLVVGNVGDCRAVLSRNGNAEALTWDHKPGTEKEKKRIENLGGYVDIHHGAWRVQGTLAVSRSIGDLPLKQWVSSEPDTSKLPITSDCEFVILASDGLWEKVNNQEAVDIARPLCIEEKHGQNSLPELFELGQAWNDENSSPPPKARKISLGTLPKILKVRSVSGNYGNIGCTDQDLKENTKITGSQLSAKSPMMACKKLVELSTSRGTLDDVSVMIVNLRNFCRRKSSKM